MTAGVVGAVRFPPYREYRDSGIAWLGAIPAHWVRSSVYGTCSVKGRLGWKGLTADEYVDEGYAFLSTPNIKGTYIDFENVNHITEARYAESPEIMLEEGDVLLAKDGSTLGIVNVIRRLPAPATINSSIAVIHPDRARIQSVYLAYFMASRFMQSVIQWLKGGMGVPHLFQADIRKFPLLMPPLSEQTMIADFLDRETAKIDALVDKKERLLELLQEKRTALITYAVTKGIDRNVPMKDSGIEWLGQIPAHWNLKPLKHVASFINGTAFSPSEWGTEGTPIIRIGNLNGGEDFNYTEREVPAAFHAFKGDLLFGWSGNRGTSFGPFLWWAEGRHFVNQHIFRVCGFSVDKQWLYWTLRAATQHVEERAHGIIGMVHITRGELGAIAVPDFAKAEQRSIADYLERETARIDALIAKVHEATERLKEYRAALISAAVTGKIDVRSIET